MYRSRKCLIIGLYLFLLVVAVYGQSVEVIFDGPVQVFNYSVGRDWSFYYQINDIKYSLFARTICLISSLPNTIQVFAREDDNNPDIGMASVLIDVPKLLVEKKIGYEIVVTVQENGGRYKGNEARWKIGLTLVVKE